MSEQNDASPATILVVDDDENNRELLADMLAIAALHTRTAGSGEEALEVLAREAIDLVLLDVMMPGMDGFEVCRRIRAEPGTKTLPVVMVTALDRPEDQIKGLDAGANDFVSKPIQVDTLLARVRTQLRRTCEQRQTEAGLERQNRELAAQQARQAEMTDMVVHDMKSPLSALELGLEMLEQDLGSREDLGRTTLDTLGECAGRLRSMVHNMLQVGQMESGAIRLESSRFRFAELIDSRLGYLRDVADRQGVRLRVEPALGSDGFEGDAGLISRVLENLLSNALSFAPPGSEVRVAVAPQPGRQVLVSVSDRGPGVPPELREQIFEKFTTRAEQRASGGVNQGLGLTFCRLAVQAHGGRIWVEDNPGGGSRFCLTLAPQSEPTLAATVAAGTPSSARPTS